MKKISFKISLVLTSVLAVVGCKPKPMDPPFDASYVRQDASVDRLNLDASHPLVRMGVPNLWKKTTGKTVEGTRVTIAVVGSGVDYTIPDLRDALWMNLGELGQQVWNDDRDTDENGFADDVSGYDFFTGDGRPYDWHGHDTMIASIIGATGRANPSVVGVAPNAQLMIARYISGDGEANGYDASSALDYAVDNGARVIYFNWPQGGFSSSEDDLILESFKKAEAKNVMVVMPAGNAANQSLPDLVRAASEMPNVIVVAGADKEGRLTKT